MTSWLMGKQKSFPEFDFNELVNDCHNHLQDANFHLKNFNNNIEEYLKKLNTIRQFGSKEQIEMMKEILNLDVKPVDETKILHPILNSWDILNLDEEDETDKYNEYDDFNLDGTKSKFVKTNKGTGKGQYRDMYSQKHIRIKERS